MVLSKDNALNKNATTVVPGGVQETTITTRTTEVPVAQNVPVQNANIIKKDAVVTNVMERPVIENVIEKKNVEVHHKNVVQEIHEQKIIEIEKKPLLQNVQQPTLIQQERAATKFEEIGTGSISEQERLRLEQLRLTSAPKITQTGGVRQVQEGEQVAQVVRQEFVERHVQPVITEVREQNIVQEVVHPVVRKVHEAPIIREVQSAPLIQSTQMHAYTEDSGRFQALPARFVPSTTVHQGLNLPNNVQNPNMLRNITGAGKNHFYGLSYAGELYHLAGRDGDQSWTHIPTNGIALKDISVGRGGALFGIGLQNGQLYRMNKSANGFELVFHDNANNTRLSQLSVQSKRKIYALAEDGSAFFIKLARFGNGHQWTRLGGKLKKISSGGRLLRRTEVWGVGVDNRAYRWFNDNWVPFNVELQDISVAMDNAVYGVSMDGRLLKWNGHEQFLLQDREIKGDNSQYLTNARLTGVSAYKEGRGVYGLEQGTSNVLKMIH